MIISRHSAWRLLALSLLAFVLIGWHALQAQESFPASNYAELTGDDEVPAVETEAIGVAIMKLDFIAGRLDYRITVTDLSGPITAAHFHAGAPGESGSPVHTITFPAGKTTVTGSWTNMTEDEISNVLLGGIYINVHTAQHPDGEIRGQVENGFNGFAFLDAQSEVPPGTDPTAEGSATLLIDPVGHNVFYSLNWSGLSGSATAAHFHRGVPGKTGSPVQTITIPPGATSTSGQWENVSDEDMAALVSGGMYINIHTAQHPDGEIRGQIGHLDLYTAAISPQNEVPPVTGSSAEGTGFAISYFDPNTGISATDGIFVLNGNVNRITPAHIHLGTVGEKGPIVASLFGGAPPGHVWFALLDQTIFGGDTARSLKSGGMYVNFHSLEFPDGELRGQLIPSELNLPAPTPLSVPVTGTTPVAMQASFDHSAGSLTVRVDDGSAHGDATVVLYSLLGERIGSAGVQRGIARFDGSSLPNGMYLLQLLVDGRIAGGARIAITR